MPVESCSTLIAAPRRLVAGVVRDGEAAGESLREAGHRYSAAVRLLVPGDEVLLEARLAPGVRLPYRSRIRSVGVDGMVSELAGGLAKGLVHTTTLADAPGGTVMRDEIRWRSPFGALGRIGDAILVRRLMRDMLASRSAVYRRRAEELAGAPAVVGAAIVRDGAVLAAQRSRPADLRGRWELPGGRAEPGESEPEALARECAEELAAQVEVGERVGTDLPVTTPGGALVLRMYAAVLRPDSPEPKALEHLAVRWLTERELPTVAWVDADRAVVGDLEALLRA
ncbi:NUDIX domain-containing protein [Pseudonocardia halophobica]|uniref:NUDIX domain-containing protein n=1 Tax=Pseudonocardia halophobica TaxID=29401 RepID=UPI0022AF4AA7|nr:NUDIX domain-containing protein [Pseudonocardia halophobica]